MTSVVDHERNLKRQFAKTLVINNEDSKTLFISEPQEIGSDTLMTRYSPSGKKRAVLKEFPSEDGGGGKKRVVEIWNGERRDVVKDVTKAHEEFYNDGAKH